MYLANKMSFKYINCKGEVITTKKKFSIGSIKNFRFLHELQLFIWVTIQFYQRGYLSIQDVLKWRLCVRVYEIDHLFIQNIKKIVIWDDFRNRFDFRKCNYLPKLKYIESLVLWSNKFEIWMAHGIKEYMVKNKHQKFEFRLGIAISKAFAYYVLQFKMPDGDKKQNIALWDATDKFVKMHKLFRLEMSISNGCITMKNLKE